MNSLLASPIIQTENATKIFDDGNTQIHAVNAVSLQIMAGEFTVLYGESGSGKTTLLNLLGGLEKPTSGEITVDGTLLSQLTDAQRTTLRLNKIGFVFQAYNLIPVFSALENVAFIMQMQQRDPASCLEISKAILQKVGLENLMHRRPAELSGGQQQRVAIARAIAAQPKIVLADEPTANLDRKNSQQLIELMQQLNQELGMTFVISSHDQLVIQSAKRKIQLQDGKILSDEIAHG